MPTYEYRCKQCDETLEVVQAFTDDALTECPSCGGPLRKVFGNVGITFKGSGFYKTDSRASSTSTSSTSSSSSSGASSTEGSGSDSGSSSSTGSDSSSSNKDTASTSSTSSAAAK